MNRIFGPLAAVILVAGTIYNILTFTVGEWETAIVLQFGKPVSTVHEPGLHFKKPFVHEVRKFDKRLLNYDAAPKVLITKDKQQLVVDNFSRWRITDPLQFFQSVQTIGNAQTRLDDIIYSVIREAVARQSLTETVSGNRAELLAYVTDESNKKTVAYGIEIIDVRIKRADLPEKNEQNVFRRMRTERERQAKRFRAEGEEESRKIRSGAERERQVLLAEANRTAELIRGEGDANAIAIYANAYKKDPEFYAFQRTLEAYEASLPEGTTMVLSPSAEFFSLLRGNK